MIKIYHENRYRVRFLFVIKLLNVSKMVVIYLLDYLMVFKVYDKIQFLFHEKILCLTSQVFLIFVKNNRFYSRAELHHCFKNVL